MCKFDTMSSMKKKKKKNEKKLTRWCVYSIVGSEAKARAAEFASALVFAHEYGILAASLQDRPFIPVGYVSIGGVPDSCTVAFRKWDPKLWPTTSYVLPLNAAIEAIRS